MPERTIAIKVDDEYYRRVKIRTLEKGVTLKDYILNLISEDLEKSEGEQRINGMTRAEILEKANEIVSLLNQIAN